MSGKPTTIARAFELARTGAIANLEELVRALKGEGYEQVEAHLRCSPSLNRELRSICRNSWAGAGKEPVAERRRAY
jgi:hypothetical protein